MNNMNQISKFDGEYRWLSNFYLSNIYVSGMVFPSVENAYQALKEIDRKKRSLYQGISPGEAKKLGRKAKMRNNWDKIKVQVMEELVRQKFKDIELRNKLISTGDSYLIEGNWWGDTFWGQCNGVGENNLGKILMKIRKELI